jgi:DNA-binding CsgD family transcriptional regulator
MTQSLPNPINVLPGMICSATEFFISDNEVKIIQNAKILPFCEISFATQQILNEAINEDLDAKLALHDMHPSSGIKRLEQFTKCRFGGLDFQADIKDGQLQDGEYWPCPNHGNCPHEGILCKLPIYNEQRLTTQDIQLLQLTATNKTNEAIGEEMNLPMGSFHKAKKFLYVKLGIQTKQEGVMISMFLNLIQFYN